MKMSTKPVPRGVARIILGDEVGFLKVGFRSTVFGARIVHVGDGKESSALAI